MDDLIECFFCRNRVPVGAVRMREDCTGDIAPICLECWPGPIRKPARCKPGVNRIIDAPTPASAPGASGEGG